MPTGTIACLPGGSRGGNAPKSLALAGRDGTIHPQAQRDPTRRAAVQINVVVNWFEELRT